MRLNNADGVIIGNITNHKTKATNLEEALELTGDGVFNYLVIIVSGINLLAGVILTLTIAYVLPAADCDMKLTSNEKGMLASMSFTGMIFSSHLFGFLSDNYGRRYVMIRCNIICALLCILASFAPNPSILSIIWFANGFVIAGTITPTYVIVSEFCAFKNRTRSLLICAALSSLVGVYLPCLAWFIIPLKIEVPLLPLLGNFQYSSWRLYLALTAVPLIFGTMAFMLIPESPKYLLSKGYKSETLRVLRRMYAINTNKKANQYPVEEVCLDAGDDWGDMSSKRKGFWRTMFDQTCLLFKPPLLSYMVVSCATNLGLIGAYNIIMLWLPENVSKISKYEASIAPAPSSATLCDVLENFEEIIQPIIRVDLLNGTQDSLPYGATYYNVGDIKCEMDRDVYSVNIIIGIVQFVTFGVSSKLTDLTGRKPIIVIFTLLAAGCSLFVNFVSTLYTSAFLGSVVVLVGAVLPIAISIIVDFFPTHVRTMATCICMVFGRIGASAGSQMFGFLQTNYCDTSYYGLTAFLFGIGALCLMIPLKK